MKILVPFRRVVDCNEKPWVKNDGAGVTSGQLPPGR